MRQATFNPPIKTKKDGIIYWVWAVDGEDYFIQFDRGGRQEWVGSWVVGPFIDERTGLPPGLQL